MKYTLILVAILAFVQCVDDYFELRRHEADSLVETVARCIPSDRGATMIHRTGPKLNCTMYENVGYARAPRPVGAVEVAIKEPAK